MKRRLVITLIIAACGMAQNSAFARIRLFDDKALFVAATSAIDSTGPLPNLGLLAGGPFATQTVGTVTFGLTPPSTQLYIGNGSDPAWTPLLSGNVIAISGVENLNVAFTSTVFSAGFDS